LTWCRQNLFKTIKVIEKYNNDKVAKIIGSWGAVVIYESKQRAPIALKTKIPQNVAY